jgi:superoxide dismutase, Fe-Mn family
MRKPMSFSLPELPYAYDALAPYMSRETLECHHDKHHLAYVDNGNKLAKGTEWENEPVEEVVRGTFGKNQGLFNNAGQHYNHIHFWKWMKPGGGGDKIPGELETKITADLGSVGKMKEEFIQAGVTQFGSALRANDDETKTCREFTLESIGQTSSGYAPHQRQQDACSSRR